MKQSESVKEEKNITKAFLLFLDEQFSNARAGKSVYHYPAQEFANSVRLTEVQLNELIILVTSQTALEHSDARLLQSSKILLLSGTETVTVIAARFGMSHSGFTRFFKHFVGVGPDKFREQSRM